MLSATIDKPINFAKWIESINLNKEVYLCNTTHRVVPLNHYLWLSCHQQTKQSATKSDYLFKNFVNKPIIISESSNKFNEENYKSIIKYQKIIEKNSYIKRKFVLNDIVKYLKLNNMLPAICFIFSRKNVEIAAREIDISLFEEDDKTPSIIEKECKQLLINKIPNYNEYIKLPEYIELMNLLKKGIAIHHAGIMPILREIVEFLFEKNYIKLLFATETFAVGINMPTKTVIFSTLFKFDGNSERELYSHEYIQMAGRAGRRGIDTIGHVIHCNNLFKLSSNGYKSILTGGPKLLNSKFKISFNLILNIIYSNGNSLEFDNKEFIKFLEKSMIKISLDKEEQNNKEENNKLEEKINNYKEFMKSFNTPIDILKQYDTFKNKTTLKNNQKKKNNQAIIEIEENYDIKKEYETFLIYQSLCAERKNNFSKDLTTNSYFQNNINTILSILIENKFISEEIKILDKGIISSQIQEVNPLLFGEIYDITNGFKELSSYDLILLFSCFTNINLNSEFKEYKCKYNRLNDVVNKINEIKDKYENIHNQNFIPYDSELIFHFDLIDILEDWIKCSSEETCLYILEKIKTEKDIFLGDFIKAILKINTIAQETEKIADLFNNLELKSKLQQISPMILKYIATNQSLYI